MNALQGLLFVYSFMLIYILAIKQLLIFEAIKLAAVWTLFIYLTMLLLGFILFIFGVVYYYKIKWSR